MFCMPFINTELAPTIPAIPHMLLMLRPRRDGVREDSLVLCRAALDEKILDLFQVVTTYCRDPLRRLAQRFDGRSERRLVIQLDDKSRLRGRQEVCLAAPVVADDRQSK